MGGVKLYHAGTAARELWDAGLRRPLLSFANVRSSCFNFWLQPERAAADIFLDSGAFTAHMTGTEINLQSYCDYVSATKGQFSAYAALDVIGNWRASATNLDMMLRAGLSPVPTFHRGSPLSELDRLARTHRHIALGGMMVGRQKVHRQTLDNLSPYLDGVWRVLERHWPIKVHVFGLAATQWALERYPFYSADSATISIGGSLGTYARFTDGIVRWKYWWEDVPKTLDGALSPEVAGNTTRSARSARYRQTLQAMLSLELYLTNLWAKRGVAWD